MGTDTSLEPGEIELAGLELPLKERVEAEARQPLRLFLAGPTGVGKTEISVHLAKAVNGEIVSADSMQVYRGMDIGTAKATLEQQGVVRHHLIDIKEITEPFTVVDYFYAAEQVCEDIERRGKMPIIVGGAGFYLHALLYGPPAGPPSVDTLRTQLEQRLKDEGAEALYAQLEEQDPDYAATITPHDKHKIVRALEIISLTDTPVSRLPWKSREPIVPVPFRAWFFHRPRADLYRRVEERCDAMIAEGFLDEVEKLAQVGLRDNDSASQAIGYKQALAFLDSDRSERAYERFVRDFKKASRRYVKRQFTWFRKEKLFDWIDVDDHDPQIIADQLAQGLRTS